MRWYITKSWRLACRVERAKQRRGLDADIEAADCHATGERFYWVTVFPTMEGA